MEGLSGHTPWVGSAFENGLRSIVDSRKVRVAIMGYSHHIDDRDFAERRDRVALTEEVVAAVNNGAARHRFFSQIAAAFGRDCVGFWDNVAFWNFCPEAIGASSNRYGDLARDCEPRARSRVHAITEALEPHVLIVFSGKAWSCLTRDLKTWSLVNHSPQWISEAALPTGHRAVGMRHPQGAANETLKSAVGFALE